MSDFLWVLILAALVARPALAGMLIAAWLYWLVKSDK